MSFDLLAPHYLWMEKILAGEKLQRCRTTFLDDVLHARRVLICGEGSGRFLESFLHHNPRASITCIDASSRMLDVTARKISERDRSRVELVHADVLKWRSESERYDLIVTNFFLDCFRQEQIAAIVAMLSESAARNAYWLLADFHQPKTEPAGTRARFILWLMYRFFRATTSLPASRLSPPDSYLERHGFRLVKQRLTEWGLLRADLWQRNR